MTEGRDWAVSPYLLKGNYQTMTRSISAKSGWNDILVDNPALSEFNTLGRALTAKERAIAVFLKQSEFKRPNQAPDYFNMEYWADPPPGFWVPPWDKPGPWNPGDPEDPWTLNVFNFSAFPGFCPGYKVEITWFATNPVYNMFVTTGQAELTDITGFGTPNGKAMIEVDEDFEGMVTIEAGMIAADGTPGDSNENLFPYQDCEEDAEEECPATCAFYASTTSANSVANGATVNVIGTGGTAPYTWEVETAFGDAGSGFSLGSASTSTPENTLTNTTQCGTAKVTATDACGCVIEIYVRSTYGSSAWATQLSGAAATCPDWADGVTENTGDWGISGNHMVGSYLPDSDSGDPTKERQGERQFEQLSEINIAFGNKLGAPAPCPTLTYALTCTNGGASWRETECISWPDTWFDSPRLFCSNTVSKPISNDWGSNMRYCAEMQWPECPPFSGSNWDYFLRCARVTIRYAQEWRCP